MLRERIVKVLDTAQRNNEIQGVTVLKILEEVKHCLLDNHQVAISTADPKESYYVIPFSLIKKHDLGG